MLFFWIYLSSCRWGYHIPKKSLTTTFPREAGQFCEGGNQVKQCPCDDYAVVDIKEEHNRHSGVTNTCKKIS